MPTVVSLRPSSRALLWRWGWLIPALVLAGYGWYRAATFDAPTGPHRVVWRDADGRVLESDSELSRGDVMMSISMVLGDRLIVLNRGGKGASKGYAWISPRLGEAKVAWPLPEPLFGAYSGGLAVRDAETFAFAEMVVKDDGGDVYVGIAGPNGWSVAPAPVHSWVAGGEQQRGVPIVLGMGWMGGELEVVLTHLTHDDPFGVYQPPDVVRVPVGGAPVVTSRPLPCQKCSPEAALPGAGGWKLIASSGAEGEVMLIDERGALVTPPPPGLSWWGERPTYPGTDKVRLGSLWSGVGGSHLANLDGSRQPAAPSPLPGFVQLMAASRFELVDGRLHTRPVYGLNELFTVIAHRVGGSGVEAQGARVIVAAAHADDEELQLVGDDPARLRATLRNSFSYGFRIGAFLPRPGGGYHWVTGAGGYVTLDAQLRRVDPRSLVYHLRTRGSAGDAIDEPSHVVALGWLLFGLPLCLGGGLLAGWWSRRRAVARDAAGSVAALPEAVSVGASRSPRRAAIVGLLRETTGVAALLYLGLAALALYKILPLL